MKTVRLPRLELLEIENNNGTQYGGTQQSYASFYQRLSGCGPTTAANAMIYMAKTNPNLANLFPHDNVEYNTVLSMMDRLWNYVTPGFRGVDTTQKFSAGADSYCTSLAIPLSAKSLDVPAKTEQRPSMEETTQFITGYLEQGSPIAFLNLHAGDLQTLESWHWVLIVSMSYRKDQIEVLIFDEGSCRTIDLKRWVETTKKGGGFVGFDDLSSKQSLISP